MNNNDIRVYLTALPLAQEILDFLSVKSMTHTEIQVALKNSENYVSLSDCLQGLKSRKLLFLSGGVGRKYILTDSGKTHVNEPIG